VNSPDMPFPSLSLLLEVLDVAHPSIIYKSAKIKDKSQSAYVRVRTEL